MARKLRRLTLDRVDLVDVGANPDAHIVLFKRREAPGDQAEEEVKMDEERVPEASEPQPTGKFLYRDAPMTVDQIMGYEAALHAFHELYEALEESICSIMEHAAPDTKIALLRQTAAEFSAQVEALLPALVIDGEQVEALEMCVASLKKARSERTIMRHMDTLRKVLGPRETPEDDDATPPQQKGTTDMAESQEFADLQKRLAEAEAQLAHVTDLEKRAQTAETELAVAKELARVEVEKRLEQEYIAKAKDLTSLTIDPATDWKVLRAIDTLDELVAKRVRQLLASANDMVAKGALFAMKGYDGSREAAASPTEEVQHLATEKVKTGLAKSLGEATQSVFAERPELYEAYRREVAVKTN